MSNLPILSDAELDAVAGGILNAGSATGGAGGNAASGASVMISQSYGSGSVTGNDISTNCSPATGGAGGDARGGSVNIRLAIGGRR